MFRKQLLNILATLCLCSGVALGDSNATFPVAEDPGDGSPSEVWMGGGSPRGGCGWDNGEPELTGTTNSAQWDDEYTFWAQVADTFTLDCGSGQSLITQVVFGSREHNPVCGNPGDWGGVRLTIYTDLGGGSEEDCAADANGDGAVDPLDSGFVLARLGCPVGTGDPDCDAADVNGDGVVDPLDNGFVLARFGLPCGDGPSGDPEDDGTISGTFVVDKIYSPSEFTWSVLGENRFEIVVNTALVVDDNTLYWLAVAPMEHFIGQGQTAIVSSVEGSGGDGIASRQDFPLLGVQWNPLAFPGPDGELGTEDDTPREMYFELTAAAAEDTTGACCVGGACTEGVDATECDGRFSLNTLCADVSPACDVGACCASDGSCSESNEADCGDGSFQGIGSTCGSLLCPQPPPANDVCADAIALPDGQSDYSTHGSAYSDGPVDGAAGPCGDDFVGYNDVWFTYTASCDGRLEFSLCEFCSGDTTLQVYAGTSCDPLGEQLGCGDDTCLIPAGPSVVNFCSTTVDTEYLIRLGSWNDGTLGDVTTAGLITITCSTEQQDCCTVDLCPGCADDVIEACVCAATGSFCCEVAWDIGCVGYVEDFGCGECP